MGYDLLGSGYMGSIVPAGKKLSKTQVLDAIKNKMVGVSSEVKEGLRLAYYKLGEWIRNNPKKATGAAILASAGLVASGNAVYEAFIKGDEAQQAGVISTADKHIEDSMLKAGTLSDKLQEQAAKVISDASEDKMPEGMEWWHWGLIVGGGVAAIFLVWFMFRGKKGGKRRRRR